MEKETVKDTRNLLERIQAVAIDVMNIEKDMEVGTGNYKYKAVSDKQVTLLCKKSEEKNGIVSIPIKQELIKSETLQSVPDGQGNVRITYVDIVKLTLRIYLLSDMTQFIDVESFGRGVDSSDKGFGKASTYARKYSLLNAYKIATGEDPDADKSKAIEVQQTPDVIKLRVINFLLLNDEKKDSILNTFGIGTIDELTDVQIKNIAYNLDKKGFKW